MQLSASDADIAPLMTVAVGQVLADSEDAVAMLRGKGEVQRGEPTFADVTVKSILSPTLAVVCAVEDDSPTRIVDAKTGTLLASSFQKYATRTTMVLEKRRVEGVRRSLGVHMLGTARRPRACMAAAALLLTSRSCCWSGCRCSRRVRVRTRLSLALIRTILIAWSRSPIPVPEVVL